MAVVNINAWLYPCMRGYARSRLAIDGTCLQEFDATVSGQTPALKLIDLGAHFSPPFHVR